MCKVTLKRTPVKKNHHWLHGPVVYGVYQQPSTTLQNSAPKTRRTKPRKYLPRSGLSWNTCQDFFKISNRWESALETERRCFSKMILESNVTANITRSSDSFSTVPSIVNGGDWGCIGRDLKTTMVIFSNAFNFIPQMSHYSLTLTRSRLRVSATVILTHGDDSYQSGVIGIIDQLILQNGKTLKGVQEEQKRA